MPATTPKGYPYVLPTDHPLEYPALSQQLALALDALDVEVGGVGGHMNVATNVPSSPSGSQELALTATPFAEQLWGGVTRAGNALIAPVLGLYRVSLSGTVGGAPAGTIRGLWAWSSAGGGTVDSQATIGLLITPPTNTSGVGTALTASGVWRIPAGVGVRAMARQDSGSVLTVTAALSLTLVRPL